MTTPVAVLPSAVRKRIRKRGEEAYPEECCGFLAGIREAGPWSDAGETGVTVRVVEEIPTRNVAAKKDRHRTFLVDPKAVLEVVKEYRDRDEDVVGFYHSHPDHEAGLSPTDLEFARLWPGTVWLIVPVQDGSAGEERAWWLPQSAEAMEMIIRSSATADEAITPREERA